MVRSASFNHPWRSLDSGRIAGLVVAFGIVALIFSRLMLPPRPLPEVPFDDNHMVFPVYVGVRLPCFDCGGQLQGWRRHAHTQHAQAALVPLVAPAPVYPSDVEGATGTVLLQLTIGVDGRVLAVSVKHSSGNRSLDEAARVQVLRNWRFRPKVVNGVPVQVVGELPVEFRLD